MNIEPYFDNKLTEQSDDLAVAFALEAAADLLRKTNSNYAVLGSCGLQSYFKCFFRLPNDLDVVLTATAFQSIVPLATNLGYKFVEELGRVKMWIKDYPIHLIPDEMNIVDKGSKTIFATVKLRPHMQHAHYAEMRLVNSHLIPRMRVFPLEVILFVEMIRPIYTGSVISVLLIMKELPLDSAAFALLIKENYKLRGIVQQRVLQYPAKIEQMSFFPKRDRCIAIERLRVLAAECF